jgi:hypothetical protein
MVAKIDVFRRTLVSRYIYFSNKFYKIEGVISNVIIDLTSRYKILYQSTRLLRETFHSQPEQKTILLYHMAFQSQFLISPL